MSTASAPEAARGWKWIIIWWWCWFIKTINIYKSRQLWWSLSLGLKIIVNLPDMQGRGSLGHMGCWTPLPGLTIENILITGKYAIVRIIHKSSFLAPSILKCIFRSLFLINLNWYFHLVYDVRKQLVAEAILSKANSIWSQFERTAFLFRKAQHNTQTLTETQMQVPGTCVAPLWVWLPWKKLEPKVTMWKASAILATVSWLNAQSW